MTILELMADLHKTRRIPTDEEALQIVREGTPKDVAEALVFSHCDNKVLKRAYTKNMKPAI